MWLWHMHWPRHYAMHRQGPCQWLGQEPGRRAGEVGVLVLGNTQWVCATVKKVLEGQVRAVVRCLSMQ